MKFTSQATLIQLEQMRYMSNGSLIFKESYQLISFQYYQFEEYFLLKNA